MKIAYIGRSSRAGGFSIENVFRTVARSVGLSAEVRHFNMGSRGAFLSDCARMRKLDADLFHITGDVHYAALGLDGRRTILTVHDIGHYTRVLRGWKKLLFRWLWCELPFRKVARITTVSHETRRQLLEHFEVPPGKIVVIPNPCPREFAYVPRPFTREHPVILQVGTKENKNLPRLIEALEGIPCRLVIVGPIDAAIRERLVRCRIDFEHVEKLAPADLIRRYAECDLVAFVSLFEGFGLPIIEANATGRAVVTSDCSSMPEVAGDAACLVDPLDVRSIRAGFLKVISDDGYRESLVARGLENVRRFSEEAVGKQYLDLYSELMA
jgi:glycosyltransferase involved in cell wall biosynthesis